MSVLCVYILASPPQFAAAAERFCESYSKHPAGTEHDLLIVQKGSHRWPGPPAKQLICPEEGFDIGPFQAVCSEHTDYDLVMLLSATAEIRCDDWLAKFCAPFQRSSKVAAVASSGSFEKGHSNRMLNPHLRTANIMVRPERLNELDLPQAVSKLDCWHIEHGDRNLTLTLAERGYRCLVAGRDGRGYGWISWPESETFWQGEQTNLIISDAQTDRYAEGSPELREHLTQSAWPAK